MMSGINHQSQEVARALANDHLEVDKLIHRLGALDDENKSQSFELLDLLWARLAVHIRAEHLCLFPSILGANFSDTGSGPTNQEAQSAIDQLRLDHEFFMRELGTTVNCIRNQQDSSDDELVSKQFREVRRSVVEIQTRLAKHNELEENHVYKWVNLVLDETERSALTARMRRQLENTPPRFSSDFGELDYRTKRQVTLTRSDILPPVARDLKSVVRQRVAYSSANVKCRKLPPAVAVQSPCGKFVTRISSTLRILNRSGWDGM